MATPASLFNINYTVAPGGGVVFDENTAAQISKALLSLSSSVTAAQTSADTANAAIAAANTLTGTTNQNNNTTLSQLTQTINGLPTTYVTSITASSTVNGAITFAGSCLIQASTTFSWFPFGKSSRHSLPYTYTAGDTMLLLTPTAGNTTFTLPRANTLANGSAIYIRNLSGTLTISVPSTGGDTFNGAASPYGPMNTIGNSFSGVIFVSDGVSDWITHATAG